MGTNVNKISDVNKRVNNNYIQIPVSGTSFI